MNFKINMTDFWSFIGHPRQNYLSSKHEKALEEITRWDKARYSKNGFLYITNAAPASIWARAEAWWRGIETLDDNQIEMCYPTFFRADRDKNFTAPGIKIVTWKTKTGAGPFFGGETITHCADLVPVPVIDHRGHLDPSVIHEARLLDIMLTAKKVAPGIRFDLNVSFWDRVQYEAKSRGLFDQIKPSDTNLVVKAHNGYDFVYNFLMTFPEG